MTVLPTKPVLPAMPIRYRDLTRDLDQAVARLAKATALGIDVPSDAHAVRDAQAALIRWTESDVGREYARQMRAYRDAALAYNRAVAAATQASINEQERRAIRAQMCQRCFTVHRPEVECV